MKAPPLALHRDTSSRVGMVLKSSWARKAAPGGDVLLVRFRGLGEGEGRGEYDN